MLLDGEGLHASQALLVSLERPVESSQRPLSLQRRSRRWLLRGHTVVFFATSARAEA